MPRRRPETTEPQPMPAPVVPVAWTVLGDIPRPDSWITQFVPLFRQVEQLYTNAGRTKALEVELPDPESLNRMRGAFRVLTGRFNTLPVRILRMTPTGKIPIRVALFMRDTDDKNKPADELSGVIED